MRRISRALLVAAAALSLVGCGGRYFQGAEPPPAPLQHRLADWPFREYWTGVVFNGEKVGYAHVQVDRAPDDPARYEIRSESALRIRFLGFDKRVALRARDRVGEDFALESFEYLYHLDGAELAVAGRWERGGLRIVVTNAGRATEQTLPAPAAPYPASAIAMLPAWRGLRLGAESRYTVFSGETQQLVEVVQRVEAYERSTLFEGEAWRVTTEMLALRTTTWIDARARPVLELGLNGVIVAGLEDEVRAKRYLAEGALNRRDALLELSLIRTSKPIPEPRRTTYVKLAIQGSATSSLPPGNAAQQCQPIRGGAECELTTATVPAAAGHDPRADLAPSTAVPSTDPRIRAVAAAATAGAASPTDQARAILGWLEQNVRREPADSFSALDVLATRRAECQGHAYLYAAMARALGIPTRVVNGLVYSPELEGFAYHTWNESLLAGRWVAVDPTFGQLAADATHLKLAYGENVADLTPLAAWIGTTRIEVLESR
jgi:hypothetical protein